MGGKKIYSVRGTCLNQTRVRYNKNWVFLNSLHSSCINIDTKWGLSISLPTIGLKKPFMKFNSFRSRQGKQRHISLHVSLHTWNFSTEGSWWMVFLCKFSNANNFWMASELACPRKPRKGGDIYKIFLYVFTKLILWGKQYLQLITPHKMLSTVTTSYWFMFKMYRYILLLNGIPQSSPHH